MKSYKMETAQTRQLIIIIFIAKVKMEFGSILHTLPVPLSLLLLPPAPYQVPPMTRHNYRADQWLTMRKVAAKTTAFILTSRSMGTTLGERGMNEDNWLMVFPCTGLHCTPKLSASVKYSLASPDHFLDTFPTSWVPSADSTCTWCVWLCVIISLLLFS